MLEKCFGKLDEKLLTCPKCRLEQKSGDLPVITPSVHYYTEVKSCLDEQCLAGDIVRLGENSEIRSGYAIPVEDCELALG